MVSGEKGIHVVCVLNRSDKEAIMDVIQTWNVGGRVQWNREKRARERNERDTMVRLIRDYGEGPFEVVHVLMNTPLSMDEQSSSSWESFLRNFAVPSAQTDSVVWLIVKRPDGTLLPRVGRKDRPSILHSSWFEPL